MERIVWVCKKCGGYITGNGIDSCKCLTKK